ncbi:polysaccharide pyruvyl transferase CsaB [Bacillus cereus]
MNTERKKIVLSGYYGFDNLGDEAILNYLVNFLKENNMEPIVLSANPEKTTKTYDVESVNRADFGQVLEVLKKSNGLISGGGSLLQDKTSKKSLMYYLIIMYMAKKVAKKPVYFYGQGVGPIVGKDSKFLTKFILKSTDMMSVRDEESHNFLKNTLKLKKHIDIIHDPVLFYPKNEVDKAPEGLTEEEIRFLDKRPVYVSIRPTEANQNVVNAFFKYLQYLKEKEIPVISFAFHPSQDTKITKDILEKFDNAMFIEKPINLEQGSYILAKSRLVVGMRLHSLILAASQTTPFIGVSYDPKINSFVKQFGQNVVGDIYNVTGEAIIKESELLLNNEQVSQTIIVDHLEKMKFINDKFNKKLNTIING